MSIEEFNRFHETIQVSLDSESSSAGTFKKTLPLFDYRAFFEILERRKNLQKEEMSTARRKFVMCKEVSGEKVKNNETHVPIRDFCSMLFSRRNDILDRKKTDNMAYSLGRYWINSSHNTYLMGKFTLTTDSFFDEKVN